MEAARLCTRDGDELALGRDARHGPDTSDTIATQSGQTILVESGVFFEDYWFETACPSSG